MKNLHGKCLVIGLGTINHDRYTVMQQPVHSGLGLPHGQAHLC